MPPVMPTGRKRFGATPVIESGAAAALAQQLPSERSACADVTAGYFWGETPRPHGTKSHAGIVVQRSLFLWRDRPTVLQMRARCRKTSARVGVKCHKLD